MLKQKLTKTSINNFAAAMFAVGLILFSSTGTVSANRYQDRINQLDAQINAGHEELEHLEHEAATLEQAIANLNHEIERVSAQIEKTNLQIKQVEEELAIAEAELKRQKEILAENIRQLYKNGDVTTIEMLASSDNFSDFVNREEYLTSVKLSIHETTKKIEELKAKLEKKKNELTELSEQQRSQKQVLQNTKSQQQDLLEKTRGEEARYQALLANLSQKRSDAEKALASYLASQNFVSLGPVSKGNGIGTVGNTGFSSGPHLHFEARTSNGGVTNPKPYLNSGWVWPVPNTNWMIWQDYGSPHPRYSRGWHPGIDTGYGGNLVVAMESGEIIARGCSQDYLGTAAYGYMVMIQHSNGIVSLYAHMIPPNSSAYDHCRYSYGF